MGGLGEAIERREKITGPPWAASGEGIVFSRVADGNKEICDPWHWADSEWIAKSPETFDKLVGLIEQVEEALEDALGALVLHPKWPMTPQQRHMVDALSAIREAFGRD